MLTLARRGVLASGGNVLGDIDFSHAINAGLIWAMSSHLAGSAKLGRELVGDTAFTTMGLASFTAAHPDNAVQLGLDAGNNEGAYTSAAAIFASVTTDITMWMDLTIDSIDVWATLFSLRFAASGWPDPYGRLQLIRRDTFNDQIWISFDVGGIDRVAWVTNAAITWNVPGRYQIAATRNAAGTCTFYWNGASMGTAGIATGSLDVINGSLSQPMTIFNRSGLDSGGEWLNGKCHGARIWNRVLTGPEVASLSPATAGNARLGTYI